MAEAMNNSEGRDADSSSGLCPLCGEELALDLPDWQISTKWRGVLVYRSAWSEAERKFRSLGSIKRAADELSMTLEAMRQVLEFLCLKVCGCRAVTCVSCLDDYRADL